MAASDLTIFLGQFAPGVDSLENLQTIRELAIQAVHEGADVLVCPEYAQAFAPQPGPEWALLAQPLDGHFVTELAEISAQASGVIIIAGMLVGQGDKPRNTMVAIGPAGVMAVSEKIHLYDAFGQQESQWVTRGDLTPPQLLTLGEHRIGMMACYDLRFPEVARRLVDAGATCMVVPAQWVPGPQKIEHWSTLLRARAIENQCFVVGCGQPEPYGVGRSMVVDPLGDVIVELDGQESVGVADLGVGLVDATRAANPMTNARRWGITAL